MKLVKDKDILYLAYLALSWFLCPYVSPDWMLQRSNLFCICVSIIFLWLNKMGSNWSDCNWPFFNYDMKILAILWNGRCPWQNYLQGGECGSSCTHVKCQKFEGTILQPVCKLVSFSYLLQVLQPKCTKEMLVTVTVTADRILFCEEKNSRFIHNL